MDRYDIFMVPFLVSCDLASEKVLRLDKQLTVRA